MNDRANDALAADYWVAHIWRGTADGAFQTFNVPRRVSQTVLDLVTFVQRHLDPTLSYRFACRVGMCGTCAMMVNGRPRWTCRSQMQSVAQNGEVQLAPLRNLPVIKDLATDMTDFFAKWRRAGGRFAPSQPDAEAFATVPPSGKQRRAADAGIECIGCGVCYAACDVVSWRPDYLGPAALNRAWTLINDTRDGERDERLTAVSGDAGCHSCHSHQSCTKYCPKQLSPTTSIAGLKRLSIAATLGIRL